MRTVSPDDERPHEPPAPDGASWCETWWFEVASSDGAGVAVRAVSWPALSCTWYWAHVALPDGTRIAVRDHDLPPPASGRILVRGDQFWADHVAEEPLAFWTIGLETYGVRVEDPVDALESEFGERMPVAFELELESVASAAPFGRGEGGAASTGAVATRSAAGYYEQVCAVHGEVHIGPSTSIGLSGRGARGHSWGVRPWWERCEGRAAFQVGNLLAAGFLLHGAGAAPEGYLWSAETGNVGVSDVVGEVQHDHAGLPVAARTVVNREVEIDVDVVAAFPVVLQGLRSAGSPSQAGHVVRCLCSVETSDGEGGSGWAEWVRPAAAARG